MPPAPCLLHRRHSPPSLVPGCHMPTSFRLVRPRTTPYWERLGSDTKLESKWQQKNGRSSCMGRENDFSEKLFPLFCMLRLLPQTSDFLILYLLSRNLHLLSTITHFLLLRSNFRDRRSDPDVISFPSNRTSSTFESGNSQELSDLRIEVIVGGIQIYTLGRSFTNPIYDLDDEKLYGIHEMYYEMSS
ncbi:hypothetical protein LR48_Vigan05g010700 [Vigna angularis]|uniref:Uncharacterized protein n=1 Tax=Phaseolus angularis TaxID=3914 RepID=A0A0L9UID3_PHAAN|nr:hypothetical protein LR48_Vigan05g010700 [Vigna angularis]